MKFKVVWNREAEKQLAAMWLLGEDLDAVRSSAHAIDQLLSRDPAHAGESRDGGIRILLFAPLGVLYKADLQTRLVEVLSVWKYSKRQ